MNKCRCTRCKEEEIIPTYQSIILYGTDNTNRPERYDLCSNCWKYTRQRVTLLTSSAKYQPRDKKDPEYCFKDGLDLKVHRLNGLAYGSLSTFLSVDSLNRLEKEVDKK